MCEYLLANAHTYDQIELITAFYNSNLLNCAITELSKSNIVFMNK